MFGEFALRQLLAEFFLRTESLKPAALAHSAHEANNRLDEDQASLARSHRSSIQAAIASSLLRYSAVAAVTASGAAKPFDCHLRHPSTIHARIPGHSAFSFSVRVGVAFLGGDGHGERDQVKPAADRLVHAAQARPVVAGDKELELRDKLEKVLAHEPGRDTVAARQLA